jgi:hypothetical protein
MKLKNKKINWKKKDEIKNKNKNKGVKLKKEIYCLYTNLVLYPICHFISFLQWKIIYNLCKSQFVYLV